MHPNLRKIFLATALPILITGCQAHIAPAPPPAVAMAPTDLHSPWDTTPVTITSTPYDCGPPAPIGPDITIANNLDSGKQHVSEDVKAAVYSQSTNAVIDFTTRVVKAADVFRSTGSRDAAACVTNLLAAAANVHAMTGYIAGDEAWSVRSHTIYIVTIDYLKVRAAHTASPQDNTAILQWFEDITRIERDHYEHAACTAEHCYIKNHKGLNVAALAAAVGVAANDPSLFHWAVGEYHSAVAEINGRGMLHYDTQGRYAFKNNLRSAAYLVQIAEFGETNGIPLYGYDDGVIHLLVHTVALGLVNADPYKSATGTAQATTSTIEPWEIVWASVYNRRFPDPLVTSLLNQVGPNGADMWGGDPWDVTNDLEGL